MKKEKSIDTPKQDLDILINKIKQLNLGKTKESSIFKKTKLIYTWWIKESRLWLVVVELSVNKIIKKKDGIKNKIRDFNRY